VRLSKFPYLLIKVYNDINIIVWTVFFFNAFLNHLPNCHKRYTINGFICLVNRLMLNFPIL
jgi:hypothetical protein